MKKPNYSAIALTLGLIVFSFLFVWYIFAWTEPGATPPGGNVNAPINVGGVDQWKQYLDATDGGRLGVAADGVDVSYGLTVGNAVNLLGIKSSGDIRTENQLCITGATPVECISNWPAGGAGLWTDPGTYIYPNNYTSFVITDTGNVGIGTTSPDPAAKLELAGQIKITGGTPGLNKVLTSDASGLASWQTPAGGGGFWYQTENNLYPTNTAWNVGIGTAIPGARLHVYNDVNDNLLTLERYDSVLGSTYTYFRQGTDDALVINNSGLDTLTLQGGNVGIGTTNPTQNVGSLSGDYTNTWTGLHVKESNNSLLVIEGVNGAARLHFADVNSLNRRNLILQYNDDKFSIFTMPDILFPAEYLMVIEQGGNVGIGTDDPIWNLEVVDASNPRILIKDDVNNASDNAELNLSTLGDTWSIYMEGTNNTRDLRFWNGSDRMIIKSYGYVGIGITPLAPLHVSGSPGVRIRRSAGDPTVLRFDREPGNNDYWLFEFTDPSSALHLFDQGGEVMNWGSTSVTVSRPLYANGTLTAGTLTSSGYVKVGNRGASVPPASDCDAASEYGRMIYSNAFGPILHVCGSSGWKAISLIP